MSRKLGIVVFSSHTGLGYQSLRLTQFLRPERILLVDNSSFSKNTAQHPKWYEGFSGYTCQGFPSRAVCATFLQGLTHLYVIENPLNWDLVNIARSKGIKTYIASNYEFCDNLVRPYLPLPDMFLMPSYWMVDEMKRRFGENKVKYLPPPIFPEQFSLVRDHNFSRNGKVRFLHVVGTLAAADRNGTLVLLKAMKHSTGNFELVIKSQHQLPDAYIYNNPRIKYQIGSEEEVTEIYRDFDAMILPRRFGGLCLPMQEALMSGLPVIMTAISPNNETLPNKWLIPSQLSGSIKTRTNIDLYEANEFILAAKMDSLSITDLTDDKLEAFELAHKNYAPSSLQNEYSQLW